MEFWPSDAPDGGLASLVRMIIGHRVEVIEITSVLSCCSDSGPQLQRRKADEGENEGDNPEPHHDLCFRPAELFEMMMDWRRQKNFALK